ncbi:hypothetical protein [Telluribacter sp.]|jgi:hypothetical protein|uniref:hypothetical protein n=1 Tax=Telluribacter sp. TaxID=1978767 RepID=UPI002E165A54|nr:hypothetical protein [Telluribacter sp.]
MLFTKTSLPLPILCLLFLFSGPGQAQSNENLNKENTKSTYTTKSIRNSYHYTTFEPGIVTFHDSSTVTAPLNYNWLLREMHFITEEGDTLALANGGGIAKIKLQEELFHFVPPYGFLAFVANYKNLRVSVQFLMVEKVVGTGSLSKTVMITVAKDSTGKTQLNNMRGRTILIPTKLYFLVDKNNTAHEVTKSNLLTFYPNHRREITQYIRKNSIDLMIVTQLKAVLKYCDQL